MFSVLIVSVAYNPPLTLVNNLLVNDYEHLVVDNSDQETIWLRDYCRLNGHNYKWLGENLGIAKAFNVGAEYALKHGYGYIVTMDQDSNLTSILLKNITGFILNNYSQDNRVAIFSPRHINAGEDKHVIKAKVTNDFYAMSSGNFVNLNIWKSLGGFNQDLFIDMVDVEYYVRALISGYQVLTIQNITMLHHMGENSHIRWLGKYGFDVWNHGKVRKYYQARNFFYVYNKYHQQLPELIFIKKMIRKMPISIILFENNKLVKLYYYARGYIDYIRGKFGKIYF